MSENAVFSMEVPDAGKITQELAAQEQLLPEEVRRLKEQAESNAEALFTMDIDSLKDKKKFASNTDKFGLDTMMKSSAKNSMLRVQVGKLAKAGEEGGEVSKGLLELRREVQGLDPSLVNFKGSGFFAKLFNPVRNYFERYQKAEAVIASIMVSLDKGKAVLKNDNTTLAIEQQNLRGFTKKLMQEAEMAALMDTAISVRLDRAQDENEEDERVRFVQEEILFPLRQRIMDMQQMIVVNHQGVIAMEVIQRNNKELMRGVDRAKSVTISALRTAVMVAYALYNQKIVLQKIQALNETTSDMISATSRMLRDQGGEIHTQSVEANISVDVLKEAFEDVMAALYEVSSFKQNALPVMKHNIEQFRELAAKGEAAIKKLEDGNELSSQNDW
jgi:uncharacterized protein YaaN involved in tellurite resistance